MTLVVQLGGVVSRAFYGLDIDNFVIVGVRHIDAVQPKREPDRFEWVPVHKINPIGRGEADLFIEFGHKHKGDFSVIIFRHNGRNILDNFFPFHAQRIRIRRVELLLVRSGRDYLSHIRHYASLGHFLVRSSLRRKLVLNIGLGFALRASLKAGCVRIERILMVPRDIQLETLRLF